MLLAKWIAGMGHVSAGAQCATLKLIVQMPKMNCKLMEVWCLQKLSEHFHSLDLDHIYRLNLNRYCLMSCLVLSNKRVKHNTIMPEECCKRE